MSTDEVREFDNRPEVQDLWIVVDSLPPAALVLGLTAKSLSVDGSLQTLKDRWFRFCALSQIPNAPVRWDASLDQVSDVSPFASAETRDSELPASQGEPGANEVNGDQPSRDRTPKEDQRRDYSAEADLDDLLFMGEPERRHTNQSNPPTQDKESG